MPAGAEIIEAVPIILSLIMIEGLLSVDNSLAIAAMASHLPKEQQKFALRIGIFCAYFFRGLTLALVSLIQKNLWIKWFGAIYLLYLMCAHLTVSEEDASRKKSKPKGLWLTVLSIELMDLTLSIDNVIAAVALSDRLWVVITGVFIAILVLRVLAIHAIGLIEKFPVLIQTAFLLVGYVGLLLIYEMITDVRPVAFAKFSGICLIMASTVFYSRSKTLQYVFGPLVRLALVPMRWFARTVGLILWPVTWATGKVRPAAA